MNLFRVRYGNLMVEVRGAIFTHKFECAAFATLIKVDIEPDRKLQNLGLVVVGLFIDAAELHIAHDDGLVVGVEKRTMGVGQ